MPANRFYLGIHFQLNLEVDLKKESHHLKVMRIRQGDQIELVNGLNQFAIGRMTTSDKAQLISIQEYAPPPPLILCQAIPRSSRLDTIVEKSTELGMTELWLFPSQLSEKKCVSLERLNSIMIASMKQCGRFDLPEITLKPPLEEWDLLPYHAYFGDLSPTAPSFLSVIQRGEGACFVIGPEAGFTLAEEKCLISLGARGVKLHPWILRTDTAPMVALALIASANLET